MAFELRFIEKVPKLFSIYNHATLKFTLPATKNSDPNTFILSAGCFTKSFENYINHFEADQSLILLTGV